MLNFIRFILLLGLLFIAITNSNNADYKGYVQIYNGIIDTNEPVFAFVVFVSNLFGLSFDFFKFFICFFGLFSVYFLSRELKTISGILFIILYIVVFFFNVIQLRWWLAQSFLFISFGLWLRGSKYQSTIYYMLAAFTHFGMLLFFPLLIYLRSSKLYGLSMFKLPILATFWVTLCILIIKSFPELISISIDSGFIYQKILGYTLSNDWKLNYGGYATIIVAGLICIFVYRFSKGNFMYTRVTFYFISIIPVFGYTIVMHRYLNLLFIYSCFVVLKKIDQMNYNEKINWLFVTITYGLVYLFYKEMSVSQSSVIKQVLFSLPG